MTSAVLNIIRKGGLGTINEIKKRLRKKRAGDDLTFNVGKMNRDLLKRMLVVCGRVGDETAAQYESKAKEIVVIVRFLFVFFIFFTSFYIMQ